LVPILSQLNPVHITPFYLSNIHFSSISHLRLGLTSSLFPSEFPITFRSSTMSSICPTHITLLWIG
jgi:hypothetical protein